MDRQQWTCDADQVSEPHPVLIVRSLGIGVVLGVMAGALVAGVCKLIAPAYDAGMPTLVVGLLVIALSTAMAVRRGDRRAASG
jgi:NhaP-type Na+/H+ and K+/H+ antiporter